MEAYANIRELIGKFIGKRLIDITQHDQEEFKENGISYVMLMFEDGEFLTFPIGDEGFSHSGDDDEDSEDEADGPETEAL